MDENVEKKKNEVPVAGAEEAPTAKPEQGNGWRDYLGGRNKDLNLDDDAAVGGYLQGEFDRLDKADQTNKKMNDLIMSDKRNAGLLSGVFSGQDENGEPFNLAEYIAMNWYDDLKEATNSDELAEKVNKRMAEEEKAAAAQAERSKEIDANFQKMDEALTAAMEKTGVDNETVQNLVDWLYGTDESEGLYLRIPKRAINEDDWTKLIYAFTRDKSLEDAKKAGMKEGRSSRPGAIHRSASADLAQTDLGGGSSEPDQEEDQNPTASRYGRMGRRFA